MAENVEKHITSMMEEKRVFKPSKELSQQAYIKSMAQYHKMYQKSIDDPEGFWGEMAEQLDWFKKWDKVLVQDFSDAKHEWFVGGKINVSYNCVDRHLTGPRKNKAAFIWEGDIGDVRTLTYQQLYYEVNKFANVLKKLGVKKGDRVSIYLPMIVELPIAMLACARIGAVHSVVFGAFSGDALRDRMNDCASTVLVCSDGYYRSGKTINSKDNADEALKSCPSIKKVVVVKRAGIPIKMEAGRDVWYEDLMKDPDLPRYCKPEECDAEDPLFILYTSGSTGKPKGVLHTQAGYLLYTALTFKYVMDYKDEDTYFCTADIGWITGHSYNCYGTLANGATMVLFEGVPTYPNPDRFWELIEKYKVSIFYTAPTALRSLMKDGDAWPNKHDLSSLRILATVGEPINPEAWMWYREVIGKSRCPIVDTWWQTETGMIMITPIPGAIATKPGSATRPFFGVVPEVVTREGKPVGANQGGYLVIKKPWPAMLRTIWADPDRYVKQYFSEIENIYFTGDGARCDKDGYFWVMGRVDDVINVSGHRLSTMEVESALVAHEKVAEAAVVGRPDEMKGQAIAAFVTLEQGYQATPELKDELKKWVVKEIGALARPDDIRFTDALPKTRSGKIMRRLLRELATSGDVKGDTTTLEDFNVISKLREEEE